MASPISTLPRLAEDKSQPWKAIIPSEQMMGCLKSTSVGEKAWMEWMKDVESGDPQESSSRVQEGSQIIPSSGASFGH